MIFRRKAGGGEGRHVRYSPIWLIIYSDMITNLTLFFLVSYAFTRMDAEKKASLSSTLAAMVSKDVRMQQRAERVLKQVKEQEITSKIEELEKYAKVEKSDKLLRMLLKTPVLFETGKSNIKGEAKEALDEISNTLKVINNEVIIEGHTDNVPIAGKKTNWELSIERAAAVLNYFTEEKGIPPERFIIAGYGEYQPLFPNDTPENMAQNRRIEINVLR
ncbi:MAG: flagellar motor protein MotB [Elusimicrobiota bacterium]